MDPEVRDAVVDWVREWSGRSEIATSRLLRWLTLSESKYYEWRQRYGKVNEHNGWIPRDHWLESWEREAIVEFWEERRPRHPQLRWIDPVKNSLALQFTLGQGGGRGCRGPRASLDG